MNLYSFTNFYKLRSFRLNNVKPRLILLMKEPSISFLCIILDVCESAVDNDQS